MTEAQTGGAYVGKLTAGVPGALVFLVPADRMRVTWSTVSVTPGGSPKPLHMDESALDVGLVARPLPSAGHVLAVLSWDCILNRMQVGLESQLDTSGLAELAQIRGLVDWRTRTGWSPIVPGDLPQRTGRQLTAITEMIKSVCAQASSKKVRNGTGDGGPGRYITSPSGKSLWVGAWFSWWDRYGGPLWIDVRLKTTQEMVVLAEALTAIGIEHHARSEFAQVLVPLELPLGVEQGTADKRLLAQLMAVVGAVDNLAIEVVPDQAESESGVQTEDAQAAESGAV